MTPARESAALALILLATLGLRLVRLDQPIVENYVGRQVPTAMVARNLDRGSGLLRPSLDTGPFPNLFLVEPPGYAALAVGLSRLTGLGLEPSGRLVSALALALAGWSIHGLSRRREGPAVALLAAAAFGLFPVAIRYGRAFQPDATALALVLAGVRLWDDHESRGGLGRLALAWAALAAGLALKVIFAFALAPLAAAVVPRTRRDLALVASALAPAALWYLHASRLLAEGSRASADNAAIWLGSLGASALLEPATWRRFGRYVAIRCFTPIGFGLAAFGLAIRPVPRLWAAWLIAASAMLLGLAAKAHHEYYWLALAPAVAAGAGRGLARLAGQGGGGRALAAALGVGLAALSLVQARSTFDTPVEWSGLAAAARAVDRVVPADAWLVAPEALLHASGRRGCRLEADRRSAARAAGEWGASLPESGDPAAALVELYRARGARFFADVGDPAAGRLREPLHEAIRRRYHPVWADEPGCLLVELNPVP
jgi:hypothetical protein